MRPRKDTAAPPLDPALEALLDSERAVPPGPADVRARIMARARAALAQPSSPQRRWTRTPSQWHGRARFAAAAGLLLAAATAGAVVGIHAWPRTAPAALESPPKLERGPVPLQHPAAVALTTLEGDRPGEAKVAPHPRPHGDAYAAEISLLRQAQEEAAQGRFKASLAPLAEHVRRFPTGRLAEEREALRIEALSKLGRAPEACRAAEAFRTRFPRSVLSPRVRQKCGMAE